MRVNDHITHARFFIDTLEAGEHYLLCFSYTCIIKIVSTWFKSLSSDWKTESYCISTTTDTNANRIHHNSAIDELCYPISGMYRVGGSVTSYRRRETILAGFSWRALVARSLMPTRWRQRQACDKKRHWISIGKPTGRNRPAACRNIFAAPIMRSDGFRQQFRQIRLCKQMIPFKLRAPRAVGDRKAASTVQSLVIPSR